MESLSDIETELRTLSQSSKYCELQPTVSGKPISFYFAEIADRIKAAATTTEKSSAIGNAAAMREALEFVAHMYDSPYTTYDVLVAVQKARAALSAPPRQCDVGTAKEQSVRHSNYCGTNPCHDTTSFCNWRRCFAMWAQMPYAEEGAAS